jgi:4-alpha-glucanotransferase
MDYPTMTRTMGQMTPTLEQLASICGVQCAYEDAYKNLRSAPVESLLAVLNALGVDVTSLDDVPRALAEQQTAQLERNIEPVVVAWDGGPLEFDLTLPVQGSGGRIEVTLELEDKSSSVSEQFDLGRITPQVSSCGRFATRRLRLGQRLPWGYHRLIVHDTFRRPAECEPRVRTSLVISAPRRAYEENSTAGGWGCFMPLYALRSERNWGAGDFTDLQHLAAWSGELGASVSGTLPLLAAYLDEPYEPSPYAPASRLAWNEFYVDVMRVLELAGCPKADEFMRSVEFVSEVAQLRKAEYVDYRRGMTLKRGVLEILADDFFERKPQQRFVEFEQFVAQHPHAEDYAAFRAAYERRREPWERWPQPMRDGQLSDGDYDPRVKRYHMYVQWVATRQLESLVEAARGGLYLDLPLGVRPDGYDVWRCTSAYACGASAGSPPDPVWTKGQTWCFPPLHPQRIREQGYRHVRDYLTHHMRMARILRIDHVMQLHRLFWIPQGVETSQGVYVRYRADELYAIFSLESHRHQTVLIGENLGTVPLAVDQAMDRHGLKQMYVVQYEIDSASVEAHKEEPVAETRTTPILDTRDASTTLSKVPTGALASINTHDMPSFVAWWRGEDFALRQELGLLSKADARREQLQFEQTKTKLVAWLKSAEWLARSASDDAAILLAMLRFLSASDASVVLINLEDLWLENRPQNVPGTGPERPNWKRKAAQSLEKFSRDPAVLAALQEVACLRQQRQVPAAAAGAPS